MIYLNKNIKVWFVGINSQKTRNIAGVYKNSIRLNFSKDRDVPTLHVPTTKDTIGYNIMIIKFLFYYYYISALLKMMEHVGTVILFGWNIKKSVPTISNTFNILINKYIMFSVGTWSVGTEKCTLCETKFFQLWLIYYKTNQDFIFMKSFLQKQGLL